MGAESIDRMVQTFDADPFSKWLVAKKKKYTSILIWYDVLVNNVIPFHVPMDA